MESYYIYIKNNKSKKASGMIYEKKKDKKTGFWEYAWHDQHCSGWKRV